MPRTPVHVGRDGWLFYVGFHDEVVKLYRRSIRVWLYLRRWRSLIEARSARFAAMGIRHVTTVAPEKLSVVPEMCSRRLVQARFSPGLRLAALMARSSCPGAFVDLVGPFQAEPDRAALFSRTDSHWSYAGCFLAYKRICEALGVAPQADLLDRPFREADCGDLAIHAGLDVREGVRIYMALRRAERTHISDMVRAFFEGRVSHVPGVGSYAEFHNPSPDAVPKRLLLFGTSASNFDPIFLTGMFAETFRDVHFCWTPLVDWKVVERVKPDIVVCEVIERALGWIRPDDFDTATLAELVLRDAKPPAPTAPAPTPPASTPLAAAAS